MVLNILVVLIAGFGMIALLASRKPDEFRVSRSALFRASPAALFDQVNNLYNWNNWSPWAKMDTNPRVTFDGPPAGVGASFTWAGKKTGEGTMTVIESRPGELIVFRLDFRKPFKATNRAEFIFTPEGDQTKVTWTMSGPNNFIGKVMSLFMDCEKMLGKQFDDGFANLRATVEK